MSLTVGSTLGPYLIEAPIGAGGMGEVYRARDTRLDRIVAIKVLPVAARGDASRQQRFEREARTLANLNHPHIRVLHDVGPENGTDYLVLEHVAGETLADRLARGRPHADGSRRPPMPLDEVLRNAIEMADALDAAHRHGIVHRDLKPANVMLTNTGVKLLDFGIAKLREPAAGPSGDDAEPQTVTNLTEPQAVLGTLSYMAPEQIGGKSVDAGTAASPPCH